MEIPRLKRLLEGLLHAADRPLSVAALHDLVQEAGVPTRDEVRQALLELQGEYADRAFELREVASGFRVQVRQDLEPWVGRLWEEKPPRYSRALLETLALVAYRQPVTRGEIEDIRGVSLSSGILRTLLERSWIRVLGHKDVPGRPAMYGTTREFLDYFNLKSLQELPPLGELQDLDAPPFAMDLPLEADGAAGSGSQGGTDGQGEPEAGPSAAPGEGPPPAHTALAPAGQGPADDGTTSVPPPAGEEEPQAGDDAEPGSRLARREGPEARVEHEPEMVH